MDCWVVEKRPGPVLNRNSTGAVPAAVPSLFQRVTSPESVVRVK